jgi:O-antigen/teichoic acid export membrane protein
VGHYHLFHASRGRAGVGGTVDVKRDYGFTVGVTVVVVISYLMTLRLVAHHFGADAFGEYALVRRTLAVLAPVAILGSDYATARFVAYAIGHGRPSRPYLPAALTVMLAAVAVVSCLLLVFRTASAQLFFGSAGYVSLVVLLPLLLLGTGLNSVGYNYLRGRAHFLTANVLQVVNQAGIPLVSIFVGGSVVGALLSMALGWIVVSAAFVAVMPMEVRQFRLHVTDILKYGVPRAPGDMLQLGLLAAPSVFAAHLANIRTAGLVAFGTASLTMIGTAMSPLSFILLPMSARMMAAGKLDALRLHIVSVLKLLVPIVVTGTFLLELFATPLVRAYLGKSFEGSDYIVRLILLAGPPYALYFALKSIVDARHVAPINTRNMAAAAVSFALGAALLSFQGLTIATVIADFVVSIYVLGALTAYEASKVLKQATSGGGGSHAADPVPDVEPWAG